MPEIPQGAWHDLFGCADGQRYKTPEHPHDPHKFNCLIGPISELAEELSDFLYDFEDYVEADKFDATRFSELYALSRKAAPRILHVITRMKLASPQTQDTIAPWNTENVSRYAQLPLPYPEGPAADDQIHYALRHVAKLDKTEEETPANAFTPLPYPEEENEPPLPISGPWPRTFHMSKAG